MSWVGDGVQATPNGRKRFSDKIADVDPKVSLSKANKVAGRSILTQIANCT